MSSGVIESQQHVFINFHRLINQYWLWRNYHCFHKGHNLSPKLIIKIPMNDDICRLNPKISHTNHRSDLELYRGSAVIKVVKVCINSNFEDTTFPLENNHISVSNYKSAVTSSSSPISFFFLQISTNFSVSRRSKKSYRNTYIASL